MGKSSAMRYPEFSAAPLPANRQCHECGRVLPLERFVRIKDGNAQILLCCDDCQREIHVREKQERHKRQIEKKRVEAFNDMLKQLDAKSHDAPITQEIWARLVVAMGGIEGLVNFLRDRIYSAQSETQRMRACDLLIKLANASTQFEQARRPIDKLSDEELNSELVNLLRGLPADLRRELLDECQAEGDSDADARLAGN